MEWFRKAADQGDASAQFNLGVMYANGSGTAPDPVEAHKWLSLAASAARGEEQQRYITARDTVAKSLTPEQSAQAQLRAREWQDRQKR